MVLVILVYINNCCNDNYFTKILVELKNSEILVQPWQPR